MVCAFARGPAPIVMTFEGQPRWAAVSPIIHAQGRAGTGDEAGAAPGGTLTSIRRRRLPSGRHPPRPVRAGSARRASPERESSRRRW